MRAGPLVAVRLGLAEREEVMEVRRVRFLNEEPLSLDITCVSIAAGRRLVAEDRQDRDILPILESDHGYSLEQSDLGIEGVVAGSAAARRSSTPDRRCFSARTARGAALTCVGIANKPKVLSHARTRP